MMRQPTCLLAILALLTCVGATNGEIIYQEGEYTLTEHKAIRYNDGKYDVEARPRMVTSELPVPGILGGHNVATAGSPALGINHDGVAQITIDTAPGAGTFGLCSGSLLSSGRHILTAAHCVTDGSGNLNVGTSDPNFVIFEQLGGPIAFTYSASSVNVHPGWNGNVLDGFDAAIITLGTTAPASIPRYDIVGPAAFSAVDGSKFGYGRGGHGVAGQVVPIGSIPSAKRYGQNRYEFIGLGAAGVGGINNNDTQLTYDFDSGLAANDAFGFWFGASDLGMGAGTEVNSAQGDSGGPTFINDGGVWKIAGITSYGVRLGPAAPDIDGVLNSSFGEFSVDARVANSSINNFITSVAIPEPSPFVLLSLVGLVVVVRQRVEAL